MKQNLLLVNASDEKNLPKVLEIKNLNVHLTLIGNNIPEWIKPYVDFYLECNLKNFESTLQILKTYYDEHPFHGAITFWDREVEITATITNYFELPGPSNTAIKQAKNKLLMREALSQKNIKQAKFHRVVTLDDLKNAAVDLGYPFIFKPVAASASVGVFKIENDSQLIFYYDLAHSLNKPDFWLYQDLYIAEEYMQGNEVSVEGVVNHGKIHIAGITQKWKTTNYFQEWQHCFPAILTPSIEKEIIHYTESCLNAIGLDNTAFHIELIHENNEIKIVEINARMGGDFITSYLLPLCGVNIARAAALTALGLTCQLEKAKDYACVRFLLAEAEGTLKFIKPIPIMNGIVKQFALLKKDNDSITLPPKEFADNRLCYVITKDAEFDDCIIAAKDFLDTIKFTIE